MIKYISIIVAVCLLAAGWGLLMHSLLPRPWSIIVAGTGGYIIGAAIYYWAQEWLDE